MLIYKRNVQRKISRVLYLGAEKVVFPYFHISAFYSLADRLTDKVFFAEKMLIYERKLHKLIRPRNNVTIPNSNTINETERKTSRNYRVAVLQKKV